MKTPLAVATLMTVSTVLGWGCTTVEERLAIVEPESPPPAFVAIDAGPDAEPGLVSYCPTNKCPPGWTTCPSSRFPCDVNLERDVDNCGACGRACPTEALYEAFSCMDSVCVMQCKTGQSAVALDCDGLADNGCETFANTNSNCGACGNKCSDPTKPCRRLAGTNDYQCGCAADENFCSGRCRDKNDDLHCGACNNRCDATGGGAPPRPNAYYGCNNEECGALKCRGPFGNCDGLETNGCETSLVTDANCGACGNTCPAGQACHLGSDGRPQCMCPPGQTFCEASCAGGICNGECVDLATHQYNCGACGAVCSVGYNASTSAAACKYGTCVTQCNQGLADCNRSQADGCEVNTNSDPRNCGGCGNVCDAVAGQACVAGRCVVEPCTADAGGGTAR